MTSKFTREELLNIIETDHVQCGEASALARMALAAMDSEPVILYRQVNPANGMKTYWAELDPEEFRHLKQYADENAEFMTLYRHAQQPVVPAEWTIADAVKFCKENGRQDAGAAMDAWNACRAAMLQSRCSIQPAPALDFEPKTAEARSGNSPVIPDGYVIVPKEPTERMVIAGFESEPDEGFSELQVWEAYEDMSGCEQAAYRARLCWAAMLAAAPQEVKSES
ncbi:hypothetical protein R8O49_005504 [Raoultella planticola]|uniref:hypothetical protein n=1 Tax=Raoultella planticola TaxID=575 RepID=UPI002961394D|nr:hypothetical protein [Raoultella planticola]